LLKYGAVCAMRVDLVKRVLSRLEDIERNMEVQGGRSVSDELNTMMLTLREHDFTDATNEERPLLLKIDRAISMLTIALIKERAKLNGEQASKMKEQVQLQAYHSQA